MGNHTGKARKFINRSEYVDIYDFMKPLITVTIVDGEKIATYVKPWTDEAVAKEMKSKVPHITPLHIGGLRQDVFGKLPRSNNNPSGRPSPRMLSVEARLDKLEAWAHTMDDTFEAGV